MCRMENIKIGVAEVGINLINGMDMTGYLARTSCSEGIHDELKIKSIIFHEDKTKFLLIVCDLLGLSSNYVRECIDEVVKKISVSPDNVVIACTHTHSGPASILLQDCGEVDDKWLESLKTYIAECAVKASDNLKPSILTYKTAQSNIGINRVIKEKEKQDLLVDNQIGILEVKDALSGVVKAVLVNYACHPVVMNETNLLYSKDYPHFMIEKLNKTADYSNASVIFTNGCCGDINPSDRGDFKVAEKLGHKLAGSITDTAITQINEDDLSRVNLKVKTIKVKIPLEHELNKEVAEKQENEYMQLLDEEMRKHSASADIKLYRALKNWAGRMSSMICSGTLENEIVVDIKIICIGMLTIVTLPFEVFHEIGLKIKKHFGSDRCIVLGYANGDYGYLPSKVLYPVASYEAGMAFKFYGFPGPVCRDTEDIILNAIKE